jgi:lysyl-tRNA synthetase class 1
MSDRSARRSVTHWADRIAREVEAAGRGAVISTGISPSGEIHIGNMREVLTGDAVFRALRDRGAAARFNYVSDSFDPLRRVYPFLDAARYENLVGRPLSEIPCPCGQHASYAEHYLVPFLGALQTLAVEAEVVRADELYKSGRMTPFIVRALEQRDRIAAILHELTGKQIEAHWSPFTPLCPSCGRMGRARVLGFDARAATIDYGCECGASGTLPMAGAGKLVWRIDWPARWVLFGVTVEPFGKDHATRGGSYETGARVAREVFGGEPPLPVPYEWIRLRGGGDMSSSKGNVLSVARMLDVVPPEALRYLVIREPPQRSITFDPGLPLLRLVDEVDDIASQDRDERALQLSLAGSFQPLGVPFKHLVVVAQAAAFDPERTLSILERTGYPALAREALPARVRQARAWLESFAPEELRFTVQQVVPPAVAQLTAEQRRLLGLLAQRLEQTRDPEATHNLIHEMGRESLGGSPAALFEAIYVSLLGKPRGPRAGWFIALLGVELCRARFEEVAASVSS